MRAGCTVQKHGLCAGGGPVEGPDVRLAVLERNVSAVHAAVHGRTCLVGGGLGDGVVAVGELELHDVAYSGSDGVWDEGVLGSTDDHGDDLAGATEGITWLVARSVSQM